MATASVWDRHEARLLLRGAGRRAHTLGSTVGLLVGLGLGLGLTRLFS
ncbi:MAG: hypothetical protein ACE147_16530 [Candidatus Methylomirabilales bacterium]